MYITRAEVEKILQVMNDFPDAFSYQVKVDSSSGIGSVLTLHILTAVNGYDGEFITEISGVENW